MTRAAADQEAQVASPLAAPEPWDLVADAYVAELLPQFEPFSRDALRLAMLPPAAKVADVAAGPGTLALLAAAQGATVSAIDFSPAMVSHLQHRAAAAALTGIDVQVGDGQALPFQSDAYDGAFSMFGLMFFPDRAAGFRELRRVLRPQARAVVSSWAPFRGPLVSMMESLSAALPGLPLKQGALPLGDPDECARETTQAGFRAVKVHIISHGLTVPSLSEFWASLQRTMAPIVLLRHKMGEERWAEIAARIFDRMRAEIGEGPVDVPFTAYLSVGAK